MEVKDAKSGKSWHRALEQEHVSRNSTSTSFSAYPWDGNTQSNSKDGGKVTKVPNGTYTITLWVQRALGEDENKQAHWEKWDSPPIEIKRP